jgi:hypothetical protein
VYLWDAAVHYTWTRHFDDGKRVGYVFPSAPGEVAERLNAPVSKTG